MPSCNVYYREKVYMMDNVAEAMPQEGAQPQNDAGKVQNNEESSTETRSVFPETWLWKRLTVGSSGKASMTAKVPDSITSWQLAAWASSAAKGVGVASKGDPVIVFKPFFVVPSLPYSIVRGEVVSIPVRAITTKYSISSFKTKLLSILSDL